MNKINKIVNEQEHGVRLDVYVAKHGDMSRAMAQKLIEQELVLVNGQPSINAYRVEVGDVIEIGQLEVPSIEPTPIAMDLDIIFEDDDVLVINKPAGLVVHPSPSFDGLTLVSGLLAHSDVFANMADPLRPGIVHRLDKDTSGLMVVAKNDQALLHLQQQIQDNTMERIYHGLVHGQVFPDVFNIDGPIGRHPHHRQNMTVIAHNSKEALTLVRVLERYHETSLVECSLKTGRTHQIRVHMQFIGHPLVFDPKYGRRKDKKTGQLLVAKQLNFDHPTTHKRLEFEVDYPSTLQTMINKVRKEMP